MAQHDYVLENQSGALIRQDLNNALAAIATNNMAATAPTTTYAGMFWLDTLTSPATLRIRNDVNSAWISCGNLSEMSYLAGVTSGIQEQLNGKLSTANLLNAVKAVDGIGSGLDADLLRGLPADFTSSLGEKGWQKLPSGLIIQWGTQSTATNTVVFPISFPNTCVHANWTFENTGFGNQPRVTARSKTGFTLAGDCCCACAGAQPAAWFAIGY